MGPLQTHRMREVVEGLTTVSDKIRALDDAGFERADIARYLQKRYQHVRNVLEAPRPRRDKSSSTKTSEAKMPASNRIKAKVQLGAGGRIVIPADMRSAMGLKEGDALQMRVVDGELRLISQQAALKRAQNLVRQYVPEGVKLVEELIAERRAEARGEEGS